ncbi:MAG: copper amine oxidase N-terminal domain-containing protein [Clostridia bacterium]|nr:copper amine oxidase N-terminal domain-containing protein [Clostridia bacterium]
MKKLLSLMAAFCMLFCLTAFADEPLLIANEEPAVEEITEEPAAEMLQPSFIMIEASVVSYDAENTALTVLSGEEELVLMIAENTVIIDAATGIPASVENLSAGTKIIAYHDIMMTMSIPPQTPALAIITGTENGCNRFFMEVASISVGEEGYTVTDTNGNYILNFTEEVALTPYRTRNIVTVNNIEVGDRLVFTTDILTMSIPAVANPSEIILIKNADQKLLADLDDVFAEKNVAPTEVDGVVYLPLRAAAEFMGYTVDWNGEAMSIILTRENRSYTLTIGQEDYGFNRSLMYFPAPALLDSTTFVPIDFVKTIR